MRHLGLLTCLCSLLLGGCITESTASAPLQTSLSQAQLTALPSPFPPLSPEEAKTPWGVEVRVGVGLAKQKDFYRAISSFKAAAILLPPHEVARKNQVAFDIIASYYHGKKYREAIEFFETSSLSQLDPQFLAHTELLVILADSYFRVGDPQRTQAAITLLRKTNPEKAQELLVSIPLTQRQNPHHDHLASELQASLDFTQANLKSPKTARTLNALLPGAGYLYVKQGSTAATSLIVNSLFAWASYRFYEQRNYGAAIATGLFELGWYVGGINGAGLAAEEYNEWVYDRNVAPKMRHSGGFPILSIHKGF